MERKFSNQELQGLKSFLVEIFEFTGEQLAAIDHQGPDMTQDMFDSILDRCEELGKDADNLFFRMLKEYPQFTEVRAERIQSEIDGVDIPMPLDEEWEIQRKKLFARIREKYGEDAI